MSLNSRVLRSVEPVQAHTASRSECFSQHLRSVDASRRRRSRWEALAPSARDAQAKVQEVGIASGVKVWHGRVLFDMFVGG